MIINKTLDNRTGGEILINSLEIEGVERIFCVPGESFIAALDSLRDSKIETIVCRQEGSAAMMAEASAKLTGTPGVCFTTRGPGTTNAASGIHVAAQDSTPLVLLIGQVARDTLGREGFQEIDYSLFLGSIAKHVEQVHDVMRIPEVMSRAFHYAVNGRPGPVVVVFPEDVLHESNSVSDLLPYHQVSSNISNEDLKKFRTLLEEASKPFLIVGGRGWHQRSREGLQNFCERWQIPVATAFRYQDAFDSTHPCYVGDIGLGINPKLEAAMMDADLIMAIGIRLGEVTTGGYHRLSIPVPRQNLVHVYSGPEELGRVFYPTLPIISEANHFALAVNDCVPSEKPSRLDYVRNLRQVYSDWIGRDLTSVRTVDLVEVVSVMNEVLNDDAIMCNGAGNHTGWLHRYYSYKGERKQLAPTSGSMGYSLPAAIAASVIYPNRQVIAFTGDGDFQMTCQELATIDQYGLSIIIVLINNSMLGTIRMHQENHYPNRSGYTELKNPDFCTLGSAYGLITRKITETAQFQIEFKQALNSSKSTLIEIISDQEDIAHNLTLSEMNSRS